jgi:hypothetical protein
MKIVFTISDFGAMMNIGADIDRTSYVVNIKDEDIPKDIMDYISGEKGNSWTVSLSILKDTKK